MARSFYDKVNKLSDLRKIQRFIRFAQKCGKSGTLDSFTTAYVCVKRRKCRKMLKIRVNVKTAKKWQIGDFLGLYK